MSLFDSIKESINRGIQKRKQNRDKFDSMQTEQRFEEMLSFDQESKRRSLIEANRIVEEDSRNLQGVQKLRAMNRVGRLTEPSSPRFGSLSEITQRNKARTRDNIERTKRMRAEAKRMQQEKLDQRVAEREARMVRNNTRKPFQPTF